MSRVMVIGIVTLTVMLMPMPTPQPQPAPAPPPNPSAVMEAIQSYDFRHAGLMVNVYCTAIMEESGGLTVCPDLVVLKVVRSVEDMPVVGSGMKAKAYTTKPKRDACLLTFTAVSIADHGSIAHEVCHCAYDGGMGRIGVRGWEGVDGAGIGVREGKAVECANRLVRKVR